MVLMIIIGPFPPPYKLFVSETNLDLRTLTWTWSAVAPDCTAVHYNILASNCGSCPTTTNHTTVTCTDVPNYDSTCSFSVQTVVCGDIVGNSSDEVQVILKDSTNQNKDCLCTGVITSAVLLGLFSLIMICVNSFMVTSLIIFIRKMKIPKSTECQYEDVSHQHPPSGSGTINTKKNVAYGQVERVGHKNS